MIERHLADWRLQDIDLLFIENVGNLVCPSSYDLGEAAKIVLLSVTEGEDKPLKYPSIFFKSELLVITKIDLLPYVPFDIAAAEENARRVHPEMEVVRASCTSDGGFRNGWPGWNSVSGRICRIEPPPWCSVEVRRHINVSESCRGGFRPCIPAGD
jgi:hydrogenase nickel incorporation protein HypB